MLDHVEHALGVLCLYVFAGAGIASAVAIVATVVPKWRHMADAIYGRPVLPAASATPHVARIPSRRGVEAAAAPALQVRR